MEENSRDLILKCAKEEFLEKGFRDASLRTIVASAGVTTGSFYWHFKNKEELFKAVVGEHYDHIMGLYTAGADEFAAMSDEDKRTFMAEIGRKFLNEMVEYIYSHKDEFMILLTGASGTEYENMLHDLAKAEIQTTKAYGDRLRETGITVRDVSPQFEHIVVSGMFTGIMDLIIHDVPKDEAVKLAEELHDFYSAGWRWVFNLHE